LYIALLVFLKDIYWAFDKLISENEEPAVIISDLLNKNKEEKKQLIARV